MDTDEKAPLQSRLTMLAGMTAAMLLAAGGLALFVLQVVGTALIIVWVGIPMVLLVVAGVRPYANLHRELAGRALGEEIPSPYRPRADGGWPVRITALLRDPATWRDLLWLIVNMTAGFAIAVTSFALAVGALWWVVLPAIWSLVPSGTFNSNYGIFSTNSQASALLVLLFAPIEFAVWWWAQPYLEFAYASIVRALLGPTSNMVAAAHAAAVAKLDARVQQLSSSRADTVDAQASELRRIERDLHDGAQARLVILGMSLGMAEELLATDPEGALKLLGEARQASTDALVELRDLVRGIHPPVLADRGLAGAVEALALASPVPTEVDIDVPGRLTDPVESAAYFALAEGLTNVIKHSGAQSARIRVRYANGVLAMLVRDDGHGGADLGKGTGLAGIERRLGAFDGTITVTSPPGGPTVVIMELPCALSSPKTSPSSGTA